MARGLEKCLEKIDQKLCFFMFGQQQILQKMIEFIEKISVQDEGSKESNIPRLSIDKKNYGVAATTNYIQPSNIDREHIGADISQQNKIAIVAGASENDKELDLDDCTNKSIGYTPKISYDTIVTLRVQTTRIKIGLQIKASNFKFSTASNFKLTSCCFQVAVVLSIRKSPRFQLQINPVLKFLEDKD